MRAVLLAGVAVVALVGQARAAVVTVGASFFYSQVPLPPLQGFLPAFASDLGTLTGVEIVLNGTTTAHDAGYASFRSPDPLPATETASAVNLTLTVPGGRTTVSGDPVTSPIVYYQPLGATAPISYSADFRSGIFNIDFVVPTANLVEYTSPFVFRQVEIELSPGFGGLRAPPGFTPYSDFLRGFDGTVQAIYTYDPVAVPEPASLALLGVGLAGLGLGLARRRKERHTAP